MIVSSLIALVAVVGQGNAQATYSSILNKVNSYQTISGTLNLQTVKPSGTTAQNWNFRILRPNYYSITSASIANYGDGASSFQYVPKANTFTKSAASKQFIPVSQLVGLESWTHADFGTPWIAATTKTATFNGHLCAAITMSPPNQMGDQEPMTVFYDQRTKLPVGFKIPLVGLATGTMMVGTYNNLKVGAPMKPSQFKWTPPKGAKLTQ